MTARNWLFDISPSGTTLTTGNVVATDATASTGVTAGTGTVASSSTRFHQGGLSAKFDMPAAGTSYVRLPIAGANLQGAFRFYHWASAPPGTTMIPMAVRQTVGIGFRLTLNPSGQIGFRSGTGVTLGTSVAAVTFGQLNRIEVVYTVATSTTGTATVRVFPGDSLTPDVALTVTNVDLGTSEPATLEMGTPSGTTSAYVQYFDSVGSNDGATVEMGPYNPSNTAPTVSGSPATQDVAGGATPTVAFTAADSDGTVATRATAFTNPGGGPTIVGPTTANPAFEVPLTGAKGSLYVMTQTVTDNLGATGTGSVEVRVPSDLALSTLAGDGTGDASWAKVGAAATRGESLSDVSDTTYIESASVTGTEQKCQFRINPSVLRSSLSFTVRTGLDVAGSATLTVRLLEGAVVRQTWTRTVTATTPYNEAVFAVSAPVVAAITDWGGLSIEVGAGT